MKKLICICLALCMCAGLAACGADAAGESGGFGFWSALLILAGLGLTAVAALRTLSLIQYNRKRKKNPKRKKPAKMDTVTLAMYAGALVLFLVAILTSCGAENPAPTEPNLDPPGTSETTGPAAMSSGSWSFPHPLHPQTA